MLQRRSLTENQVVDHLFGHMRSRTGPDTSNQHNIQVGVEERTKIRSAAEMAVLNSIDNVKYPLEDNAAGMRGRRLMEVGEILAEKTGVRMQGTTENERAAEILGRGLGGVMTPSDFPLIMSNVVNTTLLSGYDEVALNFRAICREVPFKDFKKVTRVRLSSAPGVSRVLDTGEYPNGTFDEEGEGYRIFKLGVIVGVSREMMINDDLDSIGRYPMALGRSCAEAENDEVFGILNANPNMADGNPLFGAAHKNVVTGDLDEDGLEAALLKFAEQTDMKGKPIRVRAANLVCSQRRERAARKLLVLSTSPAKTEDANPYQGQMGVVTDHALLSQVNPLTYYLFANPRLY